MEPTFENFLSFVKARHVCFGLTANRNKIEIGLLIVDVIFN